MNAPAVSRSWWLLGVVAIVVGVVLFYYNPADHSFFPPCLFHRLTGWLCPGCGATRAAHALLHGRLSEAWRYNLLLVAALPLVALYFARGRRGLVISRWGLWLAVAVVLIFGLVRNLPPGAMYAP